MNVRAERAVPARTSRTEPVVVNFDVERLKAPFLLRCGALLVDYILIVSIPVISLLLSRMLQPDPSKFIKSADTGWLILILFAVTNFVIFPMFSGQTIGKFLTGLRIVTADGSAPSFGRLLARHLIGYPLTVLTLGLGFLFSAFNYKGRALHDYLAGTVVVYGQRRTERKDN